MVAVAAATARAADPTTDPVAAADTAFALDLFRQLAPAPGNLFFSPYSISRALAMTAAGAHGSTATEMAAALHLAMPADEMAAGYAGLTKSLVAAAGDDLDVVTADSLWVQDQFSLRPEFLHTVRTQFGAEAMPADFIHQAEAARAAINGWVDGKTSGKITALIAPGMLNAATRVVLCDAIYFKGKWDHQFKPRQTGSAPFHLSPTGTAVVSTMHQTSMFRTAHADGVGLLELPYLGRQFSMVIILPEVVDGLPAVEQRLTAEQLHHWLAQLDSSRDIELSVFLPRFTGRESFQLAAQLKKLGVRRAFDARQADFSAISDAGGLCLSDVVHQAFVKVDEEGTEAAAASGVVMLAASAIARVPVFRVDHPFLYLIRDHATGTILFLGRMVDPR